MAMSGLISNRNFGSFVASGNLYRSRMDRSLQKGGVSVSGVSVIQYGGWIGKDPFSTSHCYLSSSPFSCGNVDEQREECRVLGLSKRKGPETGVGNKFRVCYKSEEYGIGETNVDRLKSTEGTGEAILLEGNLQQMSPWWQQFPKRWVIVLLCFTAFLLCNMDRVNMSIAILPM